MLDDEDFLKFAHKILIEVFLLAYLGTKRIDYSFFLNLDLEYQLI